MALATSSTRVKHSALVSGVRAFKKQISIQSMVLPGLVLILIFSIVPIYGLLMAFQNYQLGDVPGFSAWAGLKNFKLLMNDINLIRTLRNTLAMSLLKLALAFPAPILLALLFNEIPYLRYKRVLQTISYMPHFLSWVVAAALMFELLSADNGAINYALMHLGIIQKPILFMGDSAWFWPLAVFSEIWKETGWGAIIFAAAITGIDQEQYEAAEIDGAGRFGRLLHITLPGIMPTISILFILSASNMLNANFDQIMQMTGNLNNRSVAETADVLDTFIYSYGIRQGRYSFAAAATFLKSIIGAGLLVLANQSSRWLRQESLW